jgi:hypothetical protein
MRIGTVPMQPRGMLVARSCTHLLLPSNPALRPHTKSGSRYIVGGLTCWRCPREHPTQSVSGRAWRRAGDP